MKDLVLTIGNKNYSSWSLRPWLALRHAELPFQEVMIPLYTPESAARIRAVNAAGKVPVLRHGDIHIWESLAICEYVAELCPRLWPEDAGARAWARALSCEMHAGFAAVRNELPMNLRAVGRVLSPSEAAQQEIARILDAWNACRKVHAGSGPWLFGAFSIADAMYAPVVTRFISYGVPLHGAAEAYVAHVRSDPKLGEWYAAAALEEAVIPASEVGTPPAP